MTRPYKNLVAETNEKLAHVSREDNESAMVYHLLQRPVFGFLNKERTGIRPLVQHLDIAVSGQPQAESAQQLPQGDVARSLLGVLRT